MSATPATIGAYRLDRELGRGGMGVVYLGRDTRLNRPVAIKALPEHLAADPDRLARFEREARTLASLNHPHVAGIHGIEEHEGHRYLILEYVEGETLAERLERGPVPLDEALDIAVQIAWGVEAAHEAGVIHRDLKPGNVVVTPDGKAKVLDFGLARMEETSSSSSGGAMGESPTLTSPARHSPTMPGVILGTAAYMSPEQARGRRVDKRTDIWSFGGVLFEMLTGASPFIGETVSDSLGAVLHKDVDLTRLPPNTPPGVHHVLRRCLSRDKEQRYRDIGDVRLDLQHAAGTGASPASAAIRSRVPWIIATAALAVLLTGLIATRMLGRTTTPGDLPIVTFNVDTPSEVEWAPLIAPDGSAIVYRTEGAIWLRRLDRIEPKTIELPWPAIPVGWTADATAVIVLRGRPTRGELWQVGLESVTPRLIGALPEGGFLWQRGQGTAPLNDQTLLVGMASGGLHAMQLSGGASRQLLEPEPGEVTVTPSVVPGTDAVLFAEVNGGRIEVLRQGVRNIVVERPGDRISSVAYASPGFLIFEISSGVSPSGLWAVPFSPEGLETTGAPFRILPAGEFSVSSGGTLAYVERRQHVSVLRSLVWVDRRGKVEPAFPQPLFDARHPALSPDGRRIAVSARADDSNGVDFDLVILEPQTGARLQLTDSLGGDLYPSWRQDGESVVYSTWNIGIRLARERDITGQSEPRLLAATSVRARISRDNRYLVTSFNSIDYSDGKGGQPTTFFPSASFDFDLSGDAGYLAYSPVDNPGIVLRRFPSGSGQTTVTSLDASGIRFSRDDSEIFFWVDDVFMAASLDLSGPQPVVGTPRPLFEASAARLLTGSNFDPAPDGRFLMVQQPGTSRAPAGTPPERITIVQNWAAEFTRSIPAGGVAR